MGDSMLMYSEKMKRISRSRLGQSSISALHSGGALSKDKRVPIQRDETDHRDGRTKPPKPVRSLSDASKYKSLRQKHMIKIRKKTSLDMSCSEFTKDQLDFLDENQQEPRSINSAWESPKCVYQRQRKSGVTLVPKIEALNIQLQDSCVRWSPVSDSSASGLPSIGTSPPPILNQAAIRNDKPRKRNKQSWKQRSVMTLDRGEDDLFNDDESQQGIEEADSFDEINQIDQRCNPSDVSRMVMQSLSQDSDEGEKITRHQFLDTSAAELKLLSRQRHRLSSSSAPTSPTGSSDEESEKLYVRKRTQSESSSHWKPLKSVLKKRNNPQKKNLTKERRKSVTFKSQDTIRVISRCSEPGFDDLHDGATCQSQNTIVIVSN